MSSDIERPRQRTVAELLAEHGDVASSSRRRRRRSSDDEAAESVATVGVAGPIVTQRSAPGYAPAAPQVPQRPPNPPYERPDGDRLEAYRVVSRPSPPETPTDVMPRLPAAPHPPVQEPARRSWPSQGPAVGPDAELTGPIPQVAAPPAPARADAAPAPAPVGDDEDDREWDDDWSDDEWDDDRADDRADDGDERDGERAGEPGRADDGGPATGFYDVEAEEYGQARAAAAARAPAGLADPDEYADDAYADEYADDEYEDAEPARERSGPSWPAVIAQWIAGAIGGAALWVAFRFLWKGFPVVAIAAALAVTVGLVIIVRALLHNRDLRTTVFAVLVGLLLTASPAVLVLIGR